MHVKKWPSVAKALAQSTRRAINPTRENARQLELKRMQTRFSYAPLYTDYGNFCKYIGHMKVAYNPSIR